LRLAYCRNEELRKWFLLQESRLFRLRVKNEKPGKIKNLLQKNGFSYDSISVSEWKNYKDQIAFGFRPKSIEMEPMMDHYLKVPFKDAISLVGGRHVFIKQGMAYVHINDLSSIAASLFRNKLS
jgi:DNA primase large subunit